MMSRPDKRFYLFESFRVDTTERLLFKENREVPLTPKVFDGPARAIRCASAITEYASRLGIETCTGLHTGECEIVDGQVAGTAAQMCVCVANEAEPGEVLVSSTVKDLVAGSGLSFEDRGTHLLADCGEWRLFAVER